jgi:hypothetical protein
MKLNEISVEELLKHMIKTIEAILDRLEQDEENRDLQRKVDNERELDR